jgi:hypothetical protein
LIAARNLQLEGQEHTNKANPLALPSPRSKRPRRQRATKKRYDFAPSHWPQRLAPRSRNNFSVSPEGGHEGIKATSALGHKQTYALQNFAPNNDRKSGFSQRVLSALPPKSDRCSAKRDVGYGPEADIADP